MNYEKTAVKHGSPFTWSQGESLEDLSRPGRVLQIQEDYEKRLARISRQRKENPLRAKQSNPDIDDLYGASKGCLFCHK
jgi:hypothetical protein